jgi:1A family penicillin-binding protein
MKRLSRIFKILAAALLLALLAGIGGIALMFFWHIRGLPRLDDLHDRYTSQSIQVFDRTGKVLLYEFYDGEKRTFLSYDTIPQAVKDAAVAVEDAGFWTHPGLDARGILRAFLRNLAGGAVIEGGSTITQQVVKNIILSPERTFSRKVKEAVLAIELERQYSKEEILEIYLNQVPYGSNAYGIEAAARTFFSKTARELTLAETALLAALPQAPSYYSPYGPHIDELRARQVHVLTRMAELGSITLEDAERAKTESVPFKPALDQIRAPHFVFWIKEFLEANYDTASLDRKGAKVITSLDWDLQEKLEALVHETAFANEGKYRAKNAAVVVVDPRTGEVLAMIGSRDYFDASVDGNVNVATRLRQPGSAFKPFVYAAAFRKGYHPETLVYDVATNFAVPPARPYAPHNYDGRFRGPVTLYNALAQSLNIPAVKTLYLAGINDSVNLARDAGITTFKDRSRLGLSLVLGGAEVKLFELTRAYGIFANEGIFVGSKPILQIETPAGQAVEIPKQVTRHVLDADIARTVTSILSDNNARAPVFGKQSPLVVADVETAVKTGTTQEYRDAWTVGYTPSVAVGIWAGNNDNKPMTQGGAGVMAAGPLWNKAIALAAQKYPASHAFRDPAPKPPIAKHMVGGFVGGAHDILFYINKDHPAEDVPPNYGDPQFKLWEAGVERWFAAQAPPAPPPETENASTSGAESAIPVGDAGQGGGE